MGFLLKKLVLNFLLDAVIKWVLEEAKEKAAGTDPEWDDAVVESLEDLLPKLATGLRTKIV